MRQKRGAKVLVKPIPLSEKQRMRKAIEWIWEVVNVRSKYATTGKTLAERTAREMIKILNGDSAVLRKKKEVHDMALANRCVHVLLSCLCFTDLGAEVLFVAGDR